MCIYLNNYSFQSRCLVALGIFTSPLCASVNNSHYSPRFQRIIVKYHEEQFTEHDAKAQTGCRTFKTQTPSIMMVYGE